MEITDENFDVNLSRMKCAINSCDFISFDTEFSGLGNKNIYAYDTPAIAYHKMIEGVSRCMLMEFGFSTFKYVNEKNCYTYSSFNCYLFPRLPDDIRHLNDIFNCRPTFEVQTDSLILLSKHDFDYNKWINHGISYIRPCDAANMKELIIKYNEKFVKQKSANKQMAAGQTSKPTIPNELRPRISLAIAQIDEYLNDHSKQNKPCEIRIFNNSFERRIFHEMLKFKYADKVSTMTRPPNLILVSICENENESNSRFKAEYEAQMQQLEKAHGFIHVLDAITHSGKPIVTHNALLDLVYTYKTLVNELPPQWKDFCRCIQQVFPKIFDIKAILSHQPLRAIFGPNPSLYNAYEVLDSQPLKFNKIEFQPNVQDVAITNVNKHCAAYDALITGKLFANVGCYLVSQINDQLPFSHNIMMSALKSYENKISRVGRICDMNVFDLRMAGDDLPSRNHIFHMLMTNDRWTTDKIIAVFSPYSKVKVNWVDDTTCFVSLTNVKQINNVIKNLCQPTQPIKIDENLGFTLRTEADYRKSIENDLFSKNISDTTNK